MMRKMDGMIKDDFETLDYQFTLNPTQDEWVDRLGRLPADKRNLMIAYIECNCHYSELARKQKVSVQVVKQAIEEIRQLLTK